MQVTKSERLEARVTPETLELFQQAANIQGRSLSDFVVTAAQEAARKVIEEDYFIRLSIQDQQQFADLLLDPPAPSPALERAKEAHARLIRKNN